MKRVKKLLFQNKERNKSSLNRLKRRKNKPFKIQMMIIQVEIQIQIN